MDFTREPIIETVITPKEGCTLVVRSSKSSGQEEHFVDAVEVITFGSAIFFRSRERPKAFLVPVTDYEILEVRETRLLLKNVGIDRAIKIAGGREAPLNAGRDTSTSKAEQRHAHVPEKQVTQPIVQQPQLQAEEAAATDAKADIRLDKKRDRRRNHRRRRGKDDEGEKTGEEDIEGTDKLHSSEAAKVELPAPHFTKDESGATLSGTPSSSMLSSLLSPPPNLISETIARYKDNVLFKGAFFSKEDDTVGFSEGVDDEDKEDEAYGDEKNGEEEIVIDLEAQESSFKSRSRSRSDDHSHRHVLHEGMSDQEDEIQISEMSLDFPVYGSSANFDSSGAEDKSQDKSAEVILHTPHAAGYVAVHKAADEDLFKEDIFSGIEESPVAFKALPDEHLVLPIEESFFVNEGHASLPFDNFEDELPSSDYLERTLKDHISEEDANDKPNSLS